jgi:hypothetical protein
MSIWLLYLITILPNVGEVLGAIVVISLALLIVVGIMISAVESPSESLDKWLAFSESKVKYIILIIILAVIIPSEKQMYTILGGYAVTNIEGVNQLPANIVNAANAYLGKVAEDMKEKK